MSDFPVDDATLLAIEHALGGSLTFDRPEGAPDDGGPWLVGADYSIHTLMDFIGGTMGDDPNMEILEGGLYDGDPPRMIYDTRPCYTERDIIKALIAEVRRLRSEQSS